MEELVRELMAQIQGPGPSPLSATAAACHVVSARVESEGAGVSSSFLPREATKADDKATCEVATEVPFMQDSLLPAPTSVYPLSPLFETVQELQDSSHDRFVGMIGPSHPRA